MACLYRLIRFYDWGIAIREFWFFGRLKSFILLPSTASELLKIVSFGDIIPERFNRF
jgi:hypothetical protein